MSSAQNVPETPPLNGDPGEGQDDHEVYRLFEQYPFSADEQFRVGSSFEGLEVVIQNAAQQGKTQEQLNELRLQAQLFFFARQVSRQTKGALDDDCDDCRRTGHTVTRAGYRRYKDAQHVSSNAAQEPRQPSFAEIVELVKAGQTHLVPNNKVVPEGLNTNQPTISTKVSRAKPWESAVENTAPENTA
ncbi:hypothetical protein AURDEDRAFT_181596 [Auricularia subglabra TFB-10046 SS5]|nr:hypothetical protein AURDEDRAFT_181596 [Auricularia subglabra TFB-10046 SS5]